MNSGKKQKEWHNQNANTYRSKRIYNKNKSIINIKKYKIEDTNVAYLTAEEMQAIKDFRCLNDDGQRLIRQTIYLATTTYNNKIIEFKK